jgi:protease I
MMLEGVKAAVLIDDIYEDNEFWYPYFRLKEEGAAVVAVGHEYDVEYKSKHGYPKRAEMSIHDACGKEWDAVIVPGGYAPDKLRRYPEALKIVKDTFDRGGVVASICHGPWVLISAGILKGKKLTCVSAIKDDVVNAGALFEDREAVVDGNLITSRTPSDLPAFMKEVISSLKK